ncbi:unnamed protein product [Linum trigynum]
MDFDIPQADELEWLEANSNFHEEDEVQPSFQSDEEPAQSPPGSPSILADSNSGQKRLRSEVSDSSNHGEEETAAVKIDQKRSKVDDGDDEDWLRYSPPRDGVVEDDGERVDVLMEGNKDEEEEEEEEETIVSKYISKIDGDFFPVTAPGGEDRVYAKLCGVETEVVSKKLNFKPQSCGLLVEPISVLFEKADQLAFNKALKATAEVQDDAVVSHAGVVHEKLWVDKYAPNSFTELLSDEQTNREVLLWLKQWDSCVFGSEIRSTTDEVLSALKRHSTVSQHQKHSDTSFTRKGRGHKWANGQDRRYDRTNHENDNSKQVQDLTDKKPRPSGTPEQKILLLCGPPGLGKTTLAHVAAKHCGYRVVEINASDDRSSSSVEAKILDVVQMNSVTADSRPKCLVIDEIDGALGDGRGAVDVILKMVSSDKKAETGKDNLAKGEQSGRILSKKGRKTSSLSRPVICICNDLYAPALRPLRQVAKVHIFVQPTVSRVVSRLKYICNKEGMKTNAIALAALAEYTECDIRSCLNTLQFLNGKQKALNVLDIGSQVVGRKDQYKGVFDIWKEIFQKRKLKVERRYASSCTSTSDDFDFLNSRLSNRGDFDTIMDGIHENLLHLQYHDPVMQKTVKCMNSLGVFDVIHQYIMRTLQMPLYVYQAPLAVTVHRIVAQVQRPNIEWPKSYQRYRTMLTEKVELLRAWQRKIPPHISRHLSTKSFAEDSISSLLHILSPSTIRPVSLHLLSEKEKNDMDQLVNTMVSYSVTYKNVRPNLLSSKPEQEAAADASTLSFDPPITEFINFKGNGYARNTLPLALKQVLVHEVEKRRILQVSKSTHDAEVLNEANLDMRERGNLKDPSSIMKQTGASASNGEKGKKGVSIPISSAMSSSVEASHISVPNAKLNSSGNPKKSSSGAANFFDRFRKAGSRGSQKTETMDRKAATLERDSRPVLFKYNEGFTNAVKRPVKMREFLI